MRNRATKVGLFIGLMLGGGVWILGAQFSQAQTPESTLPPRPTNLTGKALAENLGLELVSEQPPGCSDYIVVESPDVGYCLEGHVQPGLQGWEIGLRLAGIVPSDLDRQIFQLQYEFFQLDPYKDRSRMEEIARQLQELQSQRG